MNNLSSILNWIGNTIGNATLGTTATTLKGAIAELNGRTTKVTGTPQQFTDGIEVTWGETTLTRIGDIVECKLRFGVRTNLPANKKLFQINAPFKPANVLRPIWYNWDKTSVHRFNLYTTGDFCTVDALPSGNQFIVTFFYVAADVQESET